MSDITALPGLDEFDLDLDAADDAYEAKPPFRTKVGGRVISFVDPQTLDWRDVAFLESPVELVRLSIADPEEREHFLAQGYKAHSLGKLANAYMAHFEFEEKMKEAQRQARFAQRG